MMFALTRSTPNDLLRAAWIEYQRCLREFVDADDGSDEESQWYQHMQAAKERLEQVRDKARAMRS